MNRAGLAALPVASALSQIALFASTRLKRLRWHAILFAIFNNRFRKFGREFMIETRHCEERSDEAIQFVARFWIASLRSQ
jgi:hypothetical protein